ncbi:MAG: DUF2110 family protein [Candidatus Thorarchaeota archaeon]
MKRIILHLRVYGQYRNRIFNKIASDIKKMVQELDIEVKNISTDKKNHIKLSIDGSDEEFVTNVLSQEYGLVPEKHTILPGSQHRGQLVDVGKVGFGLYVDIGIIKPKAFDVLIPLHRLREQTGMTKSSLRRIAKTLILVDDFPIDVKIISVDFSNQKIEAELADSFGDQLTSWINDDHERLLVFGANQSMIDQALRISRHTDDIFEIERLGYLEHSLVCKRSTRASGILAAIGPKLRGVAMHLFIPKEIKEKQNATT